MGTDTDLKVLIDRLEQTRTLSREEWSQTDPRPHAGTGGISVPEGKGHPHPALWPGYFHPGTY